MPRVVRSFVLLLASWVSCAGVVRAQATPKTVVMLVDPRVLPLSRRLEQEIESLGLAVKVIAVDASEHASLQAAALGAGAVAAIRVTPMGGGDVDMTILDGATGKTVSWKLVAPTTSEPAAAELTATRTVELLRASLLELAARRTLPPVAATPAPRVQVQPAPAAHEPAQRLSISVGPAALYSATFRPGAQLEAGIAWLPFRHFGVGAAVLAPLIPPRLTSRQGSVDLFASLYRLGALAEVGGQASPVSLRCSAGIELDKLRFEGRPTPPYVGATETRTTWSAFIGAAPHFRLAPSLSVITELVVGVASPTTVVRIAGREATTWGRPQGSAALGLELTWPGGEP
jgi:hypothetical protein